MTAGDRGGTGAAATTRLLSFSRREASGGSTRPCPMTRSGWAAGARVLGRDRLADRRLDAAAAPADSSGRHVRISPAAATQRPPSAMRDIWPPLPGRAPESQSRCRRPRQRRRPQPRARCRARSRSSAPANQGAPPCRNRVRTAISITNRNHPWQHHTRKSFRPPDERRHQQHKAGSSGTSHIDLARPADPAGKSPASRATRSSVLPHYFSNPAQ